MKLFCTFATSMDEIRMSPDILRYQTASRTDSKKMIHWYCKLKYPKAPQKKTKLCFYYTALIISIIPANPPIQWQDSLPATSGSWQYPWDILTRISYGDIKMKFFYSTIRAKKSNKACYLFLTCRLDTLQTQLYLNLSKIKTHIW